jgi:hypothetical protein
VSPSSLADLAQRLVCGSEDAEIPTFARGIVVAFVERLEFTKGAEGDRLDAAQDSFWGLGVPTRCREEFTRRAVVVLPQAYHAEDE